MTSRGGSGPAVNATGGDAGTIAFNVGGANTLTLVGELNSEGGSGAVGGAGRRVSRPADKTS